MFKSFEKGKSYPTIHLDVIHQTLYNISNEFVKAIQSRYMDMGEVLLPLSMALLTDFNDDYLGVTSQTSGNEKEA